MTDTLILRGIIDHGNVFSCPQTAPMLVGLLFGVGIWCFEPLVVALNPARDLGKGVLKRTTSLPTDWRQLLD